MSDTVLRGSVFKQRMIIPFGVGETVGKHKAVVGHKYISQKSWEVSLKKGGDTFYDIAAFFLILLY